MLVELDYCSNQLTWVEYYVESHSNTVYCAMRMNFISWTLLPDGEFSSEKFSKRKKNNLWPEKVGGPKPRIEVEEKKPENFFLSL
jgi:hypothetical protein